MRLAERTEAKSGAVPNGKGVMVVALIVAAGLALGCGRTLDAAPNTGEA